MDNSAASGALVPLFANRGWIFFMPCRRGQGLSASAGSLKPTTSTIKWQHRRGYEKESYGQPDRIAVAGNSFGGIETVLGAGRGSYCAAIDLSGGAESWRKRRCSET